MYHLKNLLLLLSFLAGTAMASDSRSGQETLRCLSLNNIRQITILDNQHIVFDTNSGGHYLNTLPYPCPSLHRSRAIMYRTSLSRLCDLDIITILDDVGPGFRPMGSCGLGTFEPVNEDEFRDLKQQRRN
ncbi:MAG: DUF6491 family protein [Gammaproteobacteria bacterium]